MTCLLTLETSISADVFLSITNSERTISSTHQYCTQSKIMSAPYYCNRLHADPLPHQLSSYNSLAAANTSSRGRIQVPPPLAGGVTANYMIAMWPASSRTTRRVTFDYPGKSGQGISMRDLVGRPAAHLANTVWGAGEQVGVLGGMGESIQLKLWVSSSISIYRNTESSRPLILSSAPDADPLLLTVARIQPH